MTVAEKELGITRIIDPKGEFSIHTAGDLARPLYSFFHFSFHLICFSFAFTFLPSVHSDVFVENPEEKAIMTYVSSLHNAFSDMALPPCHRMVSTCAHERLYCTMR